MYLRMQLYLTVRAAIHSDVLAVSNAIANVIRFLFLDVRVLRSIYLFLMSHRNNIVQQRFIYLVFITFREYYTLNTRSNAGHSSTRNDIVTPCIPCAKLV